MPLFDRLADVCSGRSVLLTGGSGFVGKWILEALRALGDRATPARVTILCRNPDRLRDSNPRLADDVELVAADVREFSLSGRRFDFIVHAANDTGPSVAADPATAVSVIVEGTRRVLEFARGRGTTGMLLLSSGAVYGVRSTGAEAFAEGDHTCTSDPTQPWSAYGNAKRLSETLAAVAWHRDAVPVKIARAFSFAGEHLPLQDQRAFGNFVCDAVAGRPIALSGDGRPVRSYLYGGDMALWLLTILTDGAPVHPYNVGSDEPIALGDLAELVARELAFDSPVPVLVGRPGAGEADTYTADIFRARTELGLDVWTDLRTCIHRTAAYARESLFAYRG